MAEQSHNKAVPVRAAQYVRMSTEHQKYSTENQSDAILQYALNKGYEIVDTYEDKGRSGLNVEGRSGLQCLLSDVENGTTNFSVVLVYDISRWGRFQDSDESAYYEYLCKRAGIRIEYCAEQFENDGSISSTIVKTVKRAMAGEYSRELSTKVFAGQCRLVELGYRQGGQAGYGLRRLLIDEKGIPKGILKRGERKSLQTDRVILTHGPQDEVDTVCWMYQVFTQGHMNERQIAEYLNDQGILTDLHHPWSRATIHQVLTNEKYIGNNVYNRSSGKLKRTRTNNPVEMWVRCKGAFDAIVDIETFDTAQSIIEERNRRFTDDQMLECLVKLLNKHGSLSGFIIDETDGIPSSGAYRNRFGSLIRAYKKVGFTPERDYRYIEINKHLRGLHPELVQETISKIEELGGQVSISQRAGLLTINNEFTASLILSRCQETKAGSLRWNIRLESSLKPDITIAVRMAYNNKEALDYYLLPSIDTISSRLRLAEDNGINLDIYRFDNLDYLYRLARRVNLKEVV
ncbi:recombinase family protein [Terasakiella sp. SH-1]|uniref:recombinase family protein n=1 Tax=Terasakiella sp. SH-1 TaxID=2560057 RepID=UPI001F0E6215|nr:recombinase family protein [Terasakiella sp. SH-1]